MSEKVIFTTESKIVYEVQVQLNSGTESERWVPTGNVHNPVYDTPNEAIRVAEYQYNREDNAPYQLNYRVVEKRVGYDQ